MSISVAPTIQADATSSISIVLGSLVLAADIIPQLEAISKPKTSSSCSTSTSTFSHGWSNGNGCSML